MAYISMIARDRDLRNEEFSKISYQIFYSSKKTTVICGRGSPGKMSNKPSYERVAAIPWIDPSIFVALFASLVMGVKYYACVRRFPWLHGFRTIFLLLLQKSCLSVIHSEALRFDLLFWFSTQCC